MTEGLSRELRKELETRDELSLALEMLVVDQATRLLALEAIVNRLVATKDVDLKTVRKWIAEEGKRYRTRFEDITGFVERSQRIAAELVEQSGAPARRKKRTAATGTKKRAAPAGKAKGRPAKARGTAGRSAKAGRSTRTKQPAKAKRSTRTNRPAKARRRTKARRSATGRRK